MNQMMGCGQTCVSLGRGFGIDLIRFLTFNVTSTQFNVYIFIFDTKKLVCTLPLELDVCYLSIHVHVSSWGHGIKS